MTDSGTTVGAEFTRILPDALMFVKRRVPLFRWPHFLGPVLCSDRVIAGCGQDREGPLLTEGRLLLGHVQQVREIGQGTAGGSLAGQQVRGSRISGQAVSGVFGC
jgi:hypothetical protein